jgi:hypothetical protein
MEYRLDMVEDAGIYEELKQLKFNVDVFRKTGWSGLVQKKLISLRRTIGMIDNRSPYPNWSTEEKTLLILNYPTPVPNVISILIFLTLLLHMSKMLKYQFILVIA